MGALGCCSCASQLWALWCLLAQWLGWCASGGNSTKGRRTTETRTVLRCLTSKLPHNAMMWVPKTGELLLSSPDRAQ